MNLWLILTVNSITLGGLLFLLSAGFSLIFGLMRIPNLTHGSFFMLGAYFGVSFMLWFHLDFWLAALLAAATVAAIGGVIERFILRRLAGADQAQVLVTLGLSFMIADLCLMQWSGDPISVDAPPALRGATQLFGLAFSIYRLAIIAIALVIAALLWLLLDRTRLGAMIHRWRGFAASASRVFLRSCFAWVRGSRVLPVSWADRSCRSIPGSTPTCCPWPWSSSSWAEPAVFLALLSAASLSAFSTISAKRFSLSSPISYSSCRWS
jgi:hypothetical protein